MKYLEEARQLCGHALPEQNWAELFSYLARKIVIAKTSIKRPSATKNGDISQVTSEKVANSERRDANESNLSELSVAKVVWTNPRYIPAQYRKALAGSDVGCSYKDPISGRICGSHEFLEIDHIQPVWAGGQNNIENLRVLCTAHNLHRYKRDAGLLPLRQ